MLKNRSRRSLGMTFLAMAIGAVCLLGIADAGTTPAFAGSPVAPLIDWGGQDPVRMFDCCTFIGCWNDVCICRCDGQLGYCPPAWEECW